MKWVSAAAFHLTEGTEGYVAMVFLCGKWNAGICGWREGIFLSQLPRGFISLPFLSRVIIELGKKKTRQKIPMPMFDGIVRILENVRRIEEKLDLTFGAVELLKSPKAFWLSWKVLGNLYKVLGSTVVDGAQMVIEHDEFPVIGSHEWKRYGDLDEKGTYSTRNFVSIVYMGSIISEASRPLVKAYLTTFTRPVSH